MVLERSSGVEVWADKVISDGLVHDKDEGVRQNTLLYQDMLIN